MAARVRAMIRAFLTAPLGRYHLLAGCAVIVGTHAVLFQMMAQTGIIEKVMALACSGWELLLIVGFLVSRILSYLLVPPLLLAVTVYVLLSWKPKAGDWTEEYGESDSRPANSNL